MCLVPYASRATSHDPPQVSHLGLAPSAQRALLTQGFVVVPGAATEMPDLYHDIEERGVPTLITSDSVLHTTRLLLDHALRLTEDAYLYGALEDLTRGLVRLSEEQYVITSDPIIKDAARHNMAFFAVALRLLDPDCFPPGPALALVERELALIEDARLTAFSPIMGPTPLDGVIGPGEDYTQYVPRGRYGETERSRGFYRAVTWYSRMAFALPEGRVEDYGLTVRALLIVRALESEAGDWLELWERIYEPLLFYSGGAGDPTVVDYMEIADEVFGAEFDIASVTDEELLEIFVRSVRDTAPSHVETHQLRGMRFLGQRSFPDAPIFDRLTRSTDRAVPTTLDMMALVGSQAAREILEEQGAFDSELYRLGFEEIELELQSMTYAEWAQNFYWSWLHAIGALLEAPGEGAPLFMMNDAWALKMLATCAAAWGEQRIDPVLVASAQTEARAGGPLRAVYVEPYPELYERLRDLLEHVRDTLWEHYLLDDELEAALSEHAGFLTALGAASRRALAGESAGNDVLNKERYSAKMRSLVDLSPETMSELGSGCCSSLAFTALGYRDFVSGRFLEVAGGDPDMLYIIVPTDGGPRVYAGAVYSFYEFARDAGPQMTVEEWRGWMHRRRAPERPGWVGRYLIE